MGEKKYIDADYLTEGRVSNDPVVIAVKCAPAADVQEVIHATYDESSVSRIGTYFIRKCMNCSKETPRANYCMWCGAKMDGEEDENV